MAFGVSDRLQKLLSSVTDMNWGWGKGGNSPESSDARPEDKKISGLNRSDTPIYNPDPNLRFEASTPEQRQEAALRARPVDRAAASRVRDKFRDTQDPR